MKLANQKFEEFINTKISDNIKKEKVKKKEIKKSTIEYVVGPTSLGSLQSFDDALRDLKDLLDSRAIKKDEFDKRKIELKIQQNSDVVSVWKWTQHGEDLHEFVKQERTLLLTNQNVYNIKKNAIQRRINTQSIKALTKSTKPDNL